MPPRVNRDPSPVASLKKQSINMPPAPPKSPGAATNASSKENELGRKSSNERKPSSSSGSGSGGGRASSPAFNGAKFDKHGYCIKHPTCQLANPLTDDDGKIIYQELKVSCPSCQSAKYKSRKGTSLGGGKVRTGYRVHGAPSNTTRSRSKSREPTERSRARSKSAPRQTSARSKSRERGGGNELRSSTRSTNTTTNSKPRREYDTPFDAKGRCHYHKNVQLAAKKFNGGWKVLHSVCPRCMEAKFDETGGGSCAAAGGGGGDDKSVRSNSSRSRSGGVVGVGGDAQGQFDKNGCCVLHTHIQVAKKRVFGTGFKVVRACPACEGRDCDLDDMSVSSKKSTRSTSSRRSTRSARSTASRGKPGKATKSGRYGALPFDADGYCCRHPNIQLAKKKTLGGFKIMHHECPECSADNGSRSSRKKSSRRKSGTGRMFDDEGSETSSFKSGKSSGSKGRKKRIRVRNLKTTDEEGKVGRYSGDVNEEHEPHGNGIMKYEDGSVWEGVFNDGAKVHGKIVKSSGGSNEKKEKKSKN